MKYPERKISICGTKSHLKYFHLDSRVTSTKVFVALLFRLRANKTWSCCTLDPIVPFAIHLLRKIALRVAIVRTNTYTRF